MYYYITNFDPKDIDRYRDAAYRAATYAFFYKHPMPPNDNPYYRYDKAVERGLWSVATYNETEGQKMWAELVNGKY